VCDAARLFRLIHDERVTLIELVPVVLKELLDHAAARPVAARELPALEFAMVTGEAVSVALVNQWFPSLRSHPARQRLRPHRGSRRHLPGDLARATSG